MTAQARTASVLLVGNPNVGKSTAFNYLTRARQRVVNAPGTTVELAEGSWRVGDADVTLVDLPGTYSLIARSPDEQVAADAVADPSHDLAVVVLDATALSRGLYLLGQVATAGRPVVAAVTMADLAATRGLRPDIDGLADALGVPVVVRNDARVATVAETVFGAGRGVSDLVYLNGSRSGIGGGAVIDGLTLRGRDGFGGEFGHTAVAGGREQCHCGRRGCLETEVSLERLLEPLGLANVDLVDLDDEIARNAADPKVLAEIQRQLGVLANAVGNAISIFNPDTVVLGGFLGSLYAAAPAVLDAAVQKDSFAPISDGIRIERAQLGSRVHLVGAAELGFLPLLRDPASYAKVIAASSMRSVTDATSA